jgi:hypothetical protein
MSNQTTLRHLGSLWWRDVNGKVANCSSRHLVRARAFPLIPLPTSHSNENWGLLFSPQPHSGRFVGGINVDRRSV